GIAVVEFADAPSPPPAGGRSAAKRPGGGDGGSANADPTPDRPGRSDPPPASDAQRILFPEKFACAVSVFTISEIEPRLFSFNNPFGACPACGGLGVEQRIDADLIVPDKDLPLRKGAIAP